MEEDGLNAIERHLLSERGILLSPLSMPKVQHLKVSPHLVYPNIDIRTLNRPDIDGVVVELRTYLRKEHAGVYYLVPFLESAETRDFTSLFIAQQRLHHALYKFMHLGVIDPHTQLRDQHGKPPYYRDFYQCPEADRLQNPDLYPT